MDASLRQKWKKLLIVLGKTPGQDVLATGRQFTYGKVLRVDYEDKDIPNIFLHVETSKGDHVIKLFEDRLFLGFCEPVEHQKIINEVKNMIVVMILL